MPEAVCNDNGMQIQSMDRRAAAMFHSKLDPCIIFVTRARLGANDLVHTLQFYMYQYTKICVVEWHR